MTVTTAGVAGFVIAAAIVIFFGGGAIYMRYYNGYWGRSLSQFDLTLAESGIRALGWSAAVLIGLLISTALLSIFLDMIGMAVLA